MENPTVRATVSETPAETACWVCWFGFAILILLMTLVPSTSRAQTPQSTKPAGSEPIPKPAAAAILDAFDKYEVVAGAKGNAVGAYEKNYPNVTFVISDLLTFDADLPGVPPNPFAAWPVPSLATARGTWVGALDIGHFFPPLIMFDKDCNAVNGFPKDVQKPMAELVDAFLYLGPPELALSEQMPADIALDADYRREELRRQTLAGFPGMPVMTEKEHE